MIKIVGFKSPAIFIWYNSIKGCSVKTREKMTMMTREEIEELKGLAASMGLYDDKKPCKRAVILGKAINTLEQEPCEDCISRDHLLSVANMDGAYGYVSTHDIAKAPPVNPKQNDVNDVLDKIRAEFISLYPKNYAGEPELGGLSCAFSLNKVLHVIDKYKAEGNDE